MAEQTLAAAPVEPEEPPADPTSVDEALAAGAEGALRRRGRPPRLEHREEDVDTGMRDTFASIMRAQYMYEWCDRWATACGKGKRAM